jgi:hypothetical protein
VIKISKEADSLYLIYQPDGLSGARWLDDKLKQTGKVTLRRTFSFTNTNLISQTTESDLDDDDDRIFMLGVLEGSYYRISKTILGLKYDLLLDKAMKLEPKTFIAERDISVFRKIDELIEEPIIVGGEDENAIPAADFNLLLKTFPTTTELTHYARSRIARILKDYFGTLSDAENKLSRYLNKRKTLTADSRESTLAVFELQKFEYIHTELKSMLATADDYKEKDWQKKILGFLLFIFPKYIAVLENVHIKDFYSKSDRPSDRYIDLMLVDANGSIDIIEVKKPFSNALLSRHKYRDSHTPRHELAGTVMQAEKYLFHLNKWGRLGELEIYKKHKDGLPPCIQLKITNPKALILIGRDNDFSEEQRFDFEIIRRKYANMLDIMTYDDLLRRLENIIFMMKYQLAVDHSK